MEIEMTNRDPVTGKKFKIDFIVWKLINLHNISPVDDGLKQTLQYGNTKLEVERTIKNLV